MPWPAYLAAIYSWFIEGLDHDSRKKVDELIFEIPPQKRAKVLAEAPEWQAEEMGRDFLAMMGTRPARAATGMEATGTMFKKA